MVQGVTDHYLAAIGALDRIPAIVGHSLGGLIIAGDSDDTAPPAITKASYRLQAKNPGVIEIVEIPGRGHSLIIDSGWHEVADHALSFVRRFVA
jgi:hypothetical protein